MHPYPATLSPFPIFSSISIPIINTDADIHRANVFNINFKLNSIPTAVIDVYIDASRHSRAVRITESSISSSDIRILE